MFLRFLLIVGSLLGSAPARSREYIPPLPKDFTQVEFYLHTVGIGDQLYNRWGHTGIRVHDKNAGSDYIFDWGIFDTSDPMFLVHFIRNVLYYRMQALPTYYKMRIYQYDKRKVWEEKLNLTGKQKRSLMEKIIWQSQPENRYYRYYQFGDNCATLPRNYLDLAVGGGIAKRLQGESSGATYLGEIYEALDYQPYLAALIDFLSNDRHNRVVSKWEQMYRPAALRQHLLTMPAFDDQGEAIPGSHLLVDSKVLFDFPILTQANPLSGFSFFFFPLLFPIAGAAYLFLMRSESGLRYRALGGAAVFWGVFAGVLACVSVFFWTCTEQWDGYHNANLWLIWPVDIIYIGLGLRWFFAREALAADNRLRIFAHWLALAHLVTIPIYIGLNVVGFFSQEVGEFQLYFSPLAILFYVLVYRWGFARDEVSSG